MEDKHRKTLTGCQVVLENDLEPNNLFAYLIQEGVMTPDDQEEINKRPTRRSQSEEFLRKLPTRGPRAYQEFVKALEKNQSFLACILLREELKIVEAKCKDLENRLAEKQEEFVAAETGSREQESQFQENREVKQGKPTDEELEKLGRDIADIWVKLGRRLGVSDPKCREIERAYVLLSEKGYHMLQHWKQIKGDDATYQALCKALQHELVQR